MGIQGFRFSNENNLEIWLKPLNNNAWAMVFVNMKDVATTINFDWNKHDIADDVNAKHLNQKKHTYKIRDLFNQINLGNTKSNLKAKIESHDVLMIKLENLQLTSQ